MNNNIIHISDGKLHPKNSPFDEVEDIIDAAIAKKNIVIHFHGGLVSLKAGRAKVPNLKKTYESAGAYPLFVLWESDIFSDSNKELKKVARKKAFSKLMKWVTKIVNRKKQKKLKSTDLLPQVDMTDFENNLDAALARIALGDKDVNFDFAADIFNGHETEITKSEIKELEKEFMHDSKLQGEAMEVLVELQKEFNTLDSDKTLMDPELVELITNQHLALNIFKFWRLSIIGTAMRVLFRLATRRDHGVATIIEEILRAIYIDKIGGQIWRDMKNKTKNSFGKDHKTFGGTAILTLLNNKIKPSDNVKITLVGHSAGAVFIAHLLNEANRIRPSGFQFNIVLLAPASTFKLTSESFTNNRRHIAGLRIFNMTDRNEKNDNLFFWLYPHSLLYFVSGVLECEADHPLVGMHRFYSEKTFLSKSKFPYVNKFKSLANDEFCASLIWSLSENKPAGQNTSSLRHGDFDSDGPTLKSIEDIIKNGFCKP